MILIADSGSTKTDWVCLKNQQEQEYFYCKGLNPVTLPLHQIQAELQDTFSNKDVRQKITQVFFFGAGCGNIDTCQVIEKELSILFPYASIQVDSDLAGAVKATCGQQAGITCILGTGSNSCLYDGQQIIDSIPSLGYQLGDEGSGNYLGKQLIKRYFYRELPKELETAFKHQYQLQRKEVIQKVYQMPLANRYLASFTSFLGDHSKHPYIINLLKSSFEEFLVRHVFKYTQHQILPIHFVGSIAYYFQDHLIACLQAHQLQIGTILKNPIKGLETYYDDRVV